MKVAAYQAPLLVGGSMGALDLIRARVLECEAEGIAVLCCPEAILGGLADHVEDPARVAISVSTGQLDAVLAPLASDVTGPAKEMASRAATALFIPCNNALPPQKGGADLVTEARRVDMATAIASEMWVIRADVAGQAGGLTSHGSSAIVDPTGTVVQSALALSEDLIATAIDVTSPSAFLPRSS